MLHPQKSSVKRMLETQGETARRFITNAPAAVLISLSGESGQLLRDRMQMCRHRD